MTQLPNKLSELLRLAVHDAQLCEQDERYELDMRVWHRGHPGGKCHVCMAGAVLAQTLQWGTETLDDSYFDDPCPEPDYIGVINALRTGDVVFACELLTQDLPNEAGLRNLDYLEEVIKSRYDSNERRADWNTYLAVADALERLGY